MNIKSYKNRVTNYIAYNQMVTKKGYKSYKSSVTATALDTLRLEAPNF